MIKICFPPGCYGHYLAQCLFYFTDIADADPQDFVFDCNGSSHAFRHNQTARQYIQIGHFSYDSSAQSHPATLTVEPGDQCITIVPVLGHWLDYFNNQYVKQSKSDFWRYIGAQISLDDIDLKLRQHWAYDRGVTSEIPRWILRELFSFYIADILHSAYAQDRCGLTDSIKIPTTLFFDRFETGFRHLGQELDVDITAGHDTLRSNNQSFQNSQRYHGSQYRCEQWVNDILLHRENESPVQTLFDEAYIQHRLRVLGYEIMCDQLNTFPATASDLRALIYKI